MSQNYGNGLSQNFSIFNSNNYSVPPINFHTKNLSMPTSNLKPINFNNNNSEQYYSPQQNHKRENSLQSNSLVFNVQKNQSVSHARNFKNRLYETDPTEQMKKQAIKNQYRNQLKIQMQADKQRKRLEKEKIEREQLQRERKHNISVGIQAQKKKVEGQRQPDSYFVVRSSETKKRKKQEAPQPQVFVHHPTTKINKRGGYHNQSTLDRFKTGDEPTTEVKQSKQGQHFNNGNMHQGKSSAMYTKETPLKRNGPPLIDQRQLEIIRQRNYEQERMSNIIKIQDKMMKKLTMFKSEIFKVKKQLDIPSQLDRIRQMLRARPLKLDDIEGGTENQQHRNYKDFYHLPVLNERRQKRQHSSSRHRRGSQRIGSSLANRTHFNDKNIQMNSQKRGRSQKKRQVKLSDKKNYSKVKQIQRNREAIQEEEVSNLSVLQQKENPEKDNEVDE